MTEAEQYLSDNKLNDKLLNFDLYRAPHKYTSDAMQEYAEAYHRAKVESIIERVDIQIKLAHDLSSPESEIQILKWFKEKLLK